MLTLHHLEKSRSFRIIWALEELALNYHLLCYYRTPSYTAPASLKKIHPLGTAPILQDNELVLVESAAILEYLQCTYDDQFNFKPKVLKHVQQYIFWLHYAESSVMPLLVFKLVLTISSQRVPFIIRPVTKAFILGIQEKFIFTRLKQHVEYIENHLSNHDYFAQDFSFADIQMTFALEAIEKLNLFATPHISHYLKRITHRTAYKNAKLKEQAGLRG
ncbi:glutathione S-transferase [Acinetobacter sp. B5B]|uniref:glutathione S-transferase n=1 Tax=Acinetobacter baretiae TaxID=2605383 RepID=UPI0018C2AE7F|nr:glutathione S-transferase [Acinetobacter baretiae]MBF7682674.1 glutathione S-transferase [Acinetobacter baretiae]